jgi:RHS repeat-associated protein
MIRKSNGTWIIETYLKDHLGNVRVAFRREGGVTQISQVDSYYPFGMNIKELTASSSLSLAPSQNEYLYNGKMMQDEMGLGWLDYGARFYDAVIGRFFVPDPLTEWHFNTTPYHYCFNNPINLFDEFGLDTTCVNSGNTIDPKTVNEHPPVMLSGPTVTPKWKWYQKAWAKFKNFFKQSGGSPLVTHDGGVDPTKNVVDHPDKPVNADLLLPALGFPSAGPRPTGMNPLTPAELIQRLKDITESSIELTSDQEILEKSGGNNNEILISTTYERAWLDNSTFFDQNGDSVVRNEGDTGEITKTFLNTATGETRKVIQLYKKGK